MSHLNKRIIKNKLGLLNLAAELGNVSRACKVMGFSRDTFYRYQAAVETGGVEALIDARSCIYPASPVGLHASRQDAVTPDLAIHCIYRTV